MAREAHARGHADGEVHPHVVVVRAHVTVLARLAGVLAVAVARVHRADGDPILMLHDLDLHLVRVAALRMFPRRHLAFARAGDGVDVAIHALDLDRLARGNLALPVELTLGNRGAGEQGGRDDERPERGEAHDHSSSWSWSWSWSWSLFSFRSLASCPGRYSRMSPLNDSTWSLALPEPILKLNRSFAFVPPTCTEYNT